MPACSFHILEKGRLVESQYTEYITGLGLLEQWNTPTQFQTARTFHVMWTEHCSPFLDVGFVLAACMERTAPWARRLNYRLVHVSPLLFRAE
jgi:hypothetical protein